MNNLSKDTFKEGIERLIIFFPSWKLDIKNSNAMLLWYNEFKDLENKQFLDMVQRYIKQEQTMPTVASLKKHSIIKPKVKQFT